MSQIGHIFNRTSTMHGITVTGHDVYLSTTAILRYTASDDGYPKAKEKCTQIIASRIRTDRKSADRGAIVAALDFIRTWEDR